MTPTSPGEDDGGFTSNWVGQQEQQLGPLQTSEETRREIQQMPSARPPVDDDEESEFQAPNLNKGTKEGKKKKKS